MARSRGGFTCKVHCLSDARGIPLVFHLTPGEAADCTAFEEVMALAEDRPAYLRPDKGYDSDAIRASLHEAGISEAVATPLAQAMADNSRHSLDSTTVRGHVSAAGAKGGLANKHLAVRGRVHL